MQNTYTICVLLLLGHVIGDFYLQSNAMVDNKKKIFVSGITKEVRRKAVYYLLMHGLVYMLCIGAVLGAAIPFSYDLLRTWLAAGLSHLIIDTFKPCINNKYKPFIVDQVLHFAAMAFTVLAWGQLLPIREFALYEASFLPQKPLLAFITGLCCLIKPVGLLIGEGELWDLKKAKPQTEEAQTGAGTMIGYLERLIVFFLIICGQIGAVGFVIAAKAVIRFPEISSDNTSGAKAALAEYYLIGTLLSMSFAFAIPLLLGLAPTS